MWKKSLLNGGKIIFTSLHYRHNPRRMTHFTTIIWPFGLITFGMSLRATRLNCYVTTQVSWMLNWKLTSLVRDPSIFIARKFKSTLSSYHSNEWGSASNTLSSNKTSLIDRIPNSFLIHGPPPDIDNTSSLCMVFTQGFCLDQPSWAELSRAEVIKTRVYCRVNWLSVIAVFTHPNCTQKADLSGCKLDFSPVEKGDMCASCVCSWYVLL